ncbi:unnamed protein product [Heligmosomoides polygyrus]|uniref:Protein YIF1 n=1 Tax=Heligmosomoides polygyrus TaxID=6339 RepID=A0A183FWA8_HELPZ|nr:unnamed protein product [Heligmosomoides polygyrus]
MLGCQAIGGAIGEIPRKLQATDSISHNISSLIIRHTGYGFPASAQAFMSDPMMQAAQHFGGQFAEQQKEKISKYLNTFNLKYYFAVDNSYVGKKLGILLFPFLHRDWSLKYAGTDEPVPAKDDVNAPDLYIPLMAFITYILVSGFVLGTQGRFSPEMLGILTSNAFIWVIIENIIIFVSKYVMNISQGNNSGIMIICLLMFMSGGKTFYYCSLAYTSLALVFFLLRTVKNFVFHSHHFGGEDGRKRKLILILFILVSQPLIMWWLTRSVGFILFFLCSYGVYGKVKKAAVQDINSVRQTRRLCRGA